MLCLLVWAESARPDALIDSLPKALWYSIVTMTTVGYGDLYPLTAAGRGIGALFLLVGVGLLALLIGLTVSLLTGRLLPRLRLWLSRRRRWYVFAGDGEAARTLAEGLTDGLAIFCEAEGSVPGLRVALPPQALFALPFAGAGERCLFCVGPDAAANEHLALALAGAPARVFCRSDAPGERLPENVTAFSEYECAARLYWQSRPWKPSGERVALLGDGRYAAALLEQALLTAPPGCAVEAFGSWGPWRRLHWALADWPGLGPELRFSDEDWRARQASLRDADRVVICGDDREANREILSQLRRYCPTAGRVDALCETGFMDAGGFGAASELYTPELVMKQALDARARQLHDLYCAQTGGGPAWERLTEFKRASNRAAADHLLTKLRLLLPELEPTAVTPEACAWAADRFEAATPAQRERYRAIEHDRWVLFHALNNWRYAGTRNDDAREHPMMTPYERLDEAERRKDDNPWLLLRALSDGGTLP